MALDLGTAPLGTAVEGGLGQQRIQQDQQRINQQATQHAGQPIQDAASGVLNKELNKITITPQLASGYSKLTGDDSAMRMVGMKMDPAIWSAMLAGGVKQKMQQEKTESQEKIEGEKSQTAEDVESTRAAAGESEAKTRAGAEVQSAKIRADAQVKAAGVKASAPSKSGSAKLSPEDTELMKTAHQYEKDLKGKSEGSWFQDSETKRKFAFLSENQDRINKIQGISGDGDAPVTVQYKGRDGSTIKKQIPKSALDEAKKKAPGLQVIDGDQ
jgi:hypothetical protein